MRSVSGCPIIQQQVDLATPRILHCADIGQRPASDRTVPAFVRIPAPPVLKHPLPSPTGGCVSSARSARSTRTSGCPRPGWSRCRGCPGPSPRGRSRDVVPGPDLRRRLAVLVRLHDPPFERLVVAAGMFRAGHRRPPISCHSSLIGLSNTL